MGITNEEYYLYDTDFSNNMSADNIEMIEYLLPLVSQYYIKPIGDIPDIRTELGIIYFNAIAK